MINSFDRFEQEALADSLPGLSWALTGSLRDDHTCPELDGHYLGSFPLLPVFVETRDSFHCACSFPILQYSPLHACLSLQTLLESGLLHPLWGFS